VGELTETLDFTGSRNCNCTQSSAVDGVQDHAIAADLESKQEHLSKVTTGAQLQLE
jgi:hypothetical protein